jgi:hypothetical protein
MMIRKILRRLGWQPAPEATLPLLPQADAPTKPVAISESTADQIPLPAPPPPPPQREEPVSKQAAQSFDRNPLDRSMDRLLAALGLLDDALPCLLQHRICPRSFVGHPCTGRHWTAVGGGEDLRKPPPLLLWPAHHAGGLCSVSPSPHPTPRSAQGISPRRARPRRGFGIACRK